MRAPCRQFLLAWLALALNALAPVLAYAHFSVGPGGGVIEHCAAGDDHDAANSHAHIKPAKSAAPHCPYCPGFAAGAAFCSAFAPYAAPGECSLPLAATRVHAAGGRSSLRIAPPRAPPPAA